MADGSLRRTLVALITTRLVISTVLLGSAAVVQWRAEPGREAWPLYALIGVTYVLSALYATVLRPSEGRHWPLDLQLGLDALTVGAFVWVTGGVTSYFSSLFVLPVITAAILQRRRRALLVALLSSLLYALEVAVQYAYPALAAWSVWTPGPLPASQVAFYAVATNTVGLTAVGALAGSLAERVRRTDQELAHASSEIAGLQAFSERIIESLTMGLVTADRPGRILTMNRAAEGIIGSLAGQAVGEMAGNVLQLPSAFAAQLAADPDWPGNRRADYRFTRPDGREIDLGLSATAFRAEGVRAGVLFTFQDVTQLRRLERDARVRQRLAAVGEMAAGLAHEIRNPLASISGSIQLLRQELPLSDEQAQLLDIVLRESGRLNDTISHFLAYARPQRFSLTRLDVRRPLRDTAMLLRNSTALGDSHTVEVDVPDEPVWCEGDEGQVSQIIWNLATNGLRAMPDGGHLRLSVRQGPDDRDAVVEVADSGVGIPEHELDRIFQPFHSTFGGGTGLGLAIVHRIVSDYGGEIRVTSKPGEGTAVAVRLPLPVTVAASEQP